MIERANCDGGCRVFGHLLCVLRGRSPILFNRPLMACYDAIEAGNNITNSAQYDNKFNFEDCELKDAFIVTLRPVCLGPDARIRVSEVLL